jgi:SAM-dependent methyltransferase
MTITPQRLHEIETRSHAFLTALHNEIFQRSWLGYWHRLLGQDRLSLWGWQRQVPLERRWQLVLEQTPQLAHFLTNLKSLEDTKHLTVLDLGCGFGMYWPILREYGFRRFVGIDLFDKRRRQSYYYAAQRYVAAFCPDCTTQLIMDDVRNLHQHQLLTDRFDLILSVATTSTKLGSTGIPHQLYSEVRQKFGAARCIEVFVERAH